MRYICCTLDIDPHQPGTEVFIAALAELGFESFEETETGVRAYIQEPLWNEDSFLQLPYLKSPEWEVSYRIEAIAPRNWNAEWERNYTPIQVGSRCTVRAPFHDPPPAGTAYDIVISPRMSFGTGHHQTTYLMLEHLLDLDLAGRAVLDMGTGTGVLAILAGMKGAGPVTAVDIDEWSFENCRENTVDNGQGQIEVLLGDIDLLEGRYFDIILANINKNVLLDHLPAYGAMLQKGGQLLLSGFYREDLTDLNRAAGKEGLSYLDSREKDGWTAALYRADR